MSHLQTHGRPDTGPLILQHEDYDKKGWDLAMRAGQHAVRAKDRLDNGDGLGHWVIDPDSQSDLLGACFWNADYNQRPMSGCAFAWPAEIKSQPSKDVATVGGPRVGKRQGDSQALPKGSGGGPDGRFNPKGVIIPFKTGSPEGDPKGGGNQAAINNAQQAAGLADAKAAAERQGLIFLPPTLPSFNPNRVDSGSSTLILGIGGSIGGFGGQGVGPGSSFAQFTGVRTNFGGSSFPKFMGVRTNFSSGSSKTGTVVSMPPEPR